MSRTAAQRESARLRKQRQRDRDRERNRQAAEALAAQHEAIAEELAPAILRHALMDGERMLVGARVVICNGRPVRALLHFNNPIENALRNSPRFTQRHKEAARRLQQDWSDVGEGNGVGSVDLMRSGGGSGDGTGGHMAMLEQISARQRLEGALAYMGAFTPSIMRVVLDCIPIKVWAHEVGKSENDALTWVSAGLTRLSAFYWPPTPDKDGEPEILTIGPPRSEYTTELSAPQGAK